MNWLLCDLHIHTTLSDGVLTPRDVVDLYGENNFDVIAITDHIWDKYTLKEKTEADKPVQGVLEKDFDKYLKILKNESERAWRKYNMLVIPGVEVTNNHSFYHILGIDVKNYVDPTMSVTQIVKALKKQNALIIAAHPDMKIQDEKYYSRHLWENREKYRSLFDAWEVANRNDLYNYVGLRKYNYVANSDFHKPSHIYSWKTLIKAEKNIESIKHAIKQNKHVAIYLMRKNRNGGKPY